MSVNSIVGEFYLTLFSLCTKSNKRGLKYLRSEMDRTKRDALTQSPKALGRSYLRSFHSGKEYHTPHPLQLLQLDDEPYLQAADSSRYQSQARVVLLSVGIKIRISGNYFFLLCFSFPHSVLPLPDWISDTCDWNFRSLCIRTFPLQALLRRKRTTTTTKKQKKEKTRYCSITRLTSSRFSKVIQRLCLLSLLITFCVSDLVASAFTMFTTFLIFCNIATITFLKEVKLKDGKKYSLLSSLGDDKAWGMI